ncbi:MAG TPA: delta-60 repeat domain-containing protein, partial [Pyrinomonadaceae bacterium]|nr:delta-60 repeat domain-containing protein [Pyrinomonadaceae bacterium]
MQTKYKLNHSLFIFGLMILFFIAAFPLVQAQTGAPGDLDTTFGNGGKVITAITSDNDYPTRARIQPDGKIVTVGIVAENGFGFPTNSFLVRHNADGTVDNSFGTNGSVIAVSSNSVEITFKDFVILRPSEGNWYQLKSTQGFAAVQFGNSTDIPAPADYDGDGKTDVAVFRDGVWYLLQSTNGFSAVQFGLANDKPVPNAFV